MLDELEVVPNLLFRNISEKFSFQQRLSRSDDFSPILQAESLSNTTYRIYFLENNKNIARLGIISSKKILPQSVSRNYSKRLIREIFRRHPISHCRLDLIVMIKRGYVNNAATNPNNLILLFNEVARKCVVF